MSLGKFTAAVASATNELSVAAASFSFDFSLMKVEAPSEFHPLGRGLSDHRRAEAETGLLHMTARKLGALFKDVAPHTPELVKAYGKRVSEISEMPNVNPRGEAHNTVFENHVGADGTSIWAAATSGIGALHIQLLACMLARVWSGPEATSVWVELVKERKRQIEERCETGELLDFGIVMATQQNLARAQLAELDSSARAWLRSADEAKQREQTQLMLIIDNLDISVSSDMKVYSSVVRAWTTALESLEKIVTGMPQSLQQEGSILLGLSAWHIYPDLLVLKKKVVNVTFNDSLIAPGGVLTVGMSVDDGDERKGIYWSLSLAHLRYYGDPVVRERSYARGSSRISFDQLGAVTLGSLLSVWGLQSQDTMSIVTCFSAMGEFLEKVAPNCHILNASNWIRFLINASRRVLESTGLDRETTMRLIGAGIRHGKQFLVAEKAIIESTFMFGLCNFEPFFSMFKGNEERIYYLRNLASKYGLIASDVFIRYVVNNIPNDATSSQKHEPRKSPTMSSVEEEVRQALVEEPDATQDNYFGNLFAGLNSSTFSPQTGSLAKHFEYASAVPRHRTAVKRRPSGTILPSIRHTRWLEKEDTQKFDSDCSRQLPCDCIEECDQYSCACMVRGHSCTSACQKSDPGPIRENCQNTEAAKRLRSRIGYFIRADEECVVQVKPMFGNRNFNTIYSITKDFVETKKRVRYNLFVGDPDTVAMYVAHDSISSASLLDFSRENCVTVNDLTKSIKSGSLSVENLLKYLEFMTCRATLPEFETFNQSTLLRCIPRQTNLLYQSLRALAAAEDIYKHLPNSTISIKVIESPIYKRHWAQTSLIEKEPTYTINDQQAIAPLELSLASSFSCVALFESGNCDISASLLDEVMALSSGDSLYVAAPLICDPYQEPPLYQLQRIVGNVGRPGLTMLVPPSNPLIRKTGPEQWNVVTHADYDGKNENSFQATTLHLSFTEYNPPINLGVHGAQDSEVFILESVVSVHDAGKWVADLDIMRVLKSRFLIRWPEGRSKPCQHHQSSRPTVKLTSIDSWEEFLDRILQGWSIARAHKNWVARLALTSVALDQKQRTIVCPADVCLGCLERDPESFKHGAVLIH